MDNHKDYFKYHLMEIVNSIAVNFIFFIVFFVIIIIIIIIIIINNLFYLFHIILNLIFVNHDIYSIIIAIAIVVAIDINYNLLIIIIVIYFTIVKFIIIVKVFNSITIPTIITISHAQIFTIKIA